MIDAVITFLITILVVALVFYLVIFVVRDVIGLPIPAKVIQIIWVIFALVVLLYAWHMFGSHLSTVPGFR